MDVCALRDLKVALPGDKPDQLDPMDHVPLADEAVSEHLVSGNVWSWAELTNVMLFRSWFVNADLPSLTLTGMTLDQCVFRSRNLIGTRWEGITVKDVILENCPLDYAFFTDLKPAARLA